MAQWLERKTGYRWLLGSNPVVRLPHLTSVFRRRHYKAVGPFYLVYMPGEVKYPAQGVNVVLDMYMCFK